MTVQTELVTSVQFELGKSSVMSLPMSMLQFETSFYHDLKRPVIATLGNFDRLEHE